ncbi:MULTISPECIES: DUF3072 domain-containing protein [Microbacterium]|jgi:hypothetical protein|uniref:DUF3072 domain-containing protein n=1 Tax=Microbacterium TaxID=33882 RepID=UPI001D17ADA7|nr:DUF3072 domain-containing protein [Microbacterium testaceum]MCC4248727.1 DUF3072 domain-containing protein [Microbacterium testaceum]
MTDASQDHEQDHEEETLGAPREGENPAEKDPSDWVTGDERMTAPQRSYLDTLAREAGEEITADLTKAEASEQIERLQQETGRSNG